MTGLEKSAKALVDKIDEVISSPSYVGVFTMAFVHGYKYNGPTFEDELNDIKAALKISEAKRRSKKITKTLKFTTYNRLPNQPKKNKKK